MRLLKQLTLDIAIILPLLLILLFVDTSISLYLQINYNHDALQEPNMITDIVRNFYYGYNIHLLSYISYIMLLSIISVNIVNKQTNNFIKSFVKLIILLVLVILLYITIAHMFSYLYKYGYTSTNIGDFCLLLDAKEDMISKIKALQQSVTYWQGQFNDTKWLCDSFTNLKGTMPDYIYESEMAERQSAFTDSRRNLDSESKLLNIMRERLERGDYSTTFDTTSTLGKRSR